ncbi:transketolase [Streptomyces sp. NPDC089919]|uniref:transketolase n=1 Tax=Streptomyces sp. NPDC089919 TaxID=3155188 RepID=UPI0034194D97
MSLSALDACRAELTAVAGDDERVVCLEAVPRYGSGHPFEAAHPDRFFRLGRADAAMVEMAAGLAVAGFRPFVVTAGDGTPEDIGRTVGYLSAGVSVIAPHDGGPLDLGALRQAAPVTLAAPYGEAETRALVRAAARTGRPHYLRTGPGDRCPPLAWEGPEPPVVNWQGGDPEGPCVVSVGQLGTAAALAARLIAPGLAHAHLLYLDEPHLAAAAAELSRRHRRFVIAGGWPGPGDVLERLARLLPHCEVVGVPVWWSGGGGPADPDRPLNGALAVRAVLAAADRLTGGRRAPAPA